jgi:hypothetical protein
MDGGRGVNVMIIIWQKYWRFLLKIQLPNYEEKVTYVTLAFKKIAIFSPKIVKKMSP